MNADLQVIVDWIMTNINNSSRQLKIDLVTGDHNPITECFVEIWSKLHVLKTNVFHNNGGELIYYENTDSGKQWVFIEDIKNEQFYCNYEYYWSILSTRFDLEYFEIQTITKLMVENILNNTIPTPIPVRGWWSCPAVAELNDTTPTPVYLHLWLYLIGNALNGCKKYAI